MKLVEVGKLGSLIGVACTAILMCGCSLAPVQQEAHVASYANAPTIAGALGQPRSPYFAKGKVTASTGLLVELEFTNLSDLTYPDADLNLELHPSVSISAVQQNWHKRLLPQKTESITLRLDVDRSKFEENNEVYIFVETPLFGPSGEMSGYISGGIRFWVTEQGGRLVTLSEAPSVTRYLQNSDPSKAPTQGVGGTRTPSATRPSREAQATAQAKRLVIRATQIAVENNAAREISPLVSPIRK